MKNKTRNTLIALAGVGFLANPAMGAVSLENGSLAVAFYQVSPGPGGGTVGPNTLVYDLGQVAGYRENTGYNVSVSTISGGPSNGNIGTALSNAFGPNWANSGTVRWLAVGNVAQGTGPITGDPGRTTYVTVAKDNFAVGTTFPSLPSGNRIPLSNNILNFFNGTQNEVSTVSNADAAQIATTELFSVDEYVNPTTTGLWFTIGTDMSQALGAGTIANGPNGLVFEGALDMYRMLHTGTGADLSVGYGGGASAVGVPQYIGTLTLDSLGNIGIIPEPSAALLGLAGGLGLCLRRRRNA